MKRKIRIKAMEKMKNMRVLTIEFLLATGMDLLSLA